MPPLADTFDAIVIGAGPNGLVAANLLADAGWEVLVLEEQHRVGGAVFSDELVEPGFTNDAFSAFFPLAKASPTIRSLGLENYGLEWCQSEVAIAHPRADDSVAFVSTDHERTVANIESFATGDGDQWRELTALWERVGPELLGSLFTLFPPVRPMGRLARKLNTGELLDFARLAVSGSRAQGEEWFAGDGGRRLLSGNALHADLSPDEAPSAVYGWVLTCLAQQMGFPTPRGGAGQIADALAARLKDRGGQIVLGQQVTRIRAESGRAQAVEFEGGVAQCRKAILADVGAPQLYLELLDAAHVPSRVLSGIKRFEYDHATVKVDWTLDASIPWTAPETRESGTVHIAEGNDALSRQAADLARGRVPQIPYLVIGQYACIDESRAPAGKDTAWAYTHVPQRFKGDEAGELSGDWGEGDERIIVDRIESEIEKLAPGFRNLIRGKHVMLPPHFERADRNLVNGAVNGGTSQIRQQLIFRPVPGLARPETPLKGLFLASASAHPGGGVHGVCGANAARAALVADGAPSARKLFGAFARRIQG